MQDGHINAYLNASIKVEAQKKTFAQEIHARDCKINILTELLADSLRTFEDKFDSNEAEFNLEQMAGYICGANYLERATGRKGYQARVRDEIEKLHF